MTRAVLLGIWTAALAGCGTTSPRYEEADQRAYLDAISQPAAAARATCASIRDPGLKGECVTTLVAREVVAGQKATVETWCSEAPEGVWRDECWFRFVESQGVGDQRLVRACAQAGSFEDACVDHLFHMGVKQAPWPTEVGQEQQVQEGVRQLVHAYFPHMVGEPRAERLDRGVAMRLAPRFANQFDATQCGQVDEVRCMYAYMEAMRELTRQLDTGPVCQAEPAQAKDVRALGIPAWDPTDAATERLAQQTWRAVCGGDWRPRAFGELQRKE